MMKLVVGYNDVFEIRKEQVFLNLGVEVTILYLSDLHLNGFSKQQTEKLISTIKTLNPDLILLGCDYVDSSKGLSYLSDLMGFLSDRSHVYAIYGNHDKLFFTRKISSIFAEHNISWIEKKTRSIDFKGIKIRIDGNQHFATPNHDLSILCLHKPIGINKIDPCYNLVFAGHLHGGQFVFWQKKEALYPGKLFYKMNILKGKLPLGMYYVSKGLGDTLPIRYNCAKDIIFVSVGPEKN